MRDMTIQLTEKCNLKCTYCMARGNDRVCNDHELSEEDFNYFLDFIKANSIDFVKITGGEPSLHSNLSFIINTIMSQGIDCHVFSNLTIRNRWEDIEIPDNVSLSVMVNVSDRNILTDTQRLVQKKNIETLKAKGADLSLSCTIYKADCIDQVNEAISLYKNWNTKRLRFSVSNPITSGSNVFLSVNQYNETIRNVLALFSNRSINAMWDCAIPFCLIDEENRVLSRATQMSYSCTPRINLCYDLRVSHCYVIPKEYEGNTSLKDFSNYDDLNDFVNNRYEKMLRDFSEFAECKSCHLRGKCTACIGLRGLIKGGSLLDAK